MKGLKPYGYPVRSLVFRNLGLKVVKSKGLCRLLLKLEDELSHMLTYLLSSGNLT